MIASIYRSARGETADEIMNRKRAPWAIRRPTIPTSLLLKGAPTKHRSVDDTLPRVPALRKRNVALQPAEQPLQESKDEVHVGGQEIEHK